MSGLPGPGGALWYRRQEKHRGKEVTLAQGTSASACKKMCRCSDECRWVLSAVSDWVLWLGVRCQRKARLAHKGSGFCHSCSSWTRGSWDDGVGLSVAEGHLRHNPSL